MKVLVVGSGGREHAVAWTLARSPKVTALLVAPGNGGTEALGAGVPVAVGDVDGLVALAQREGVDLVFVGPEAPLVAGLVDRLAAVGVPAFGPSAACARLEGSKAFSKAVMDRCGVPTARWEAFTTADAAIAWLDAEVPGADAGRACPFVVKASGLAAGKGVVLPATVGEAHAAIREMFAGAFGEAGSTVVLEERLEGEEASLLAFCDGTSYAVMPPAQDHKRVGEGDTGPNTGGMGAYAPAPVASALRDELAEVAIRPILDAFRADGTPFVGVLYAGLMLTPTGPKVLEYNTRFGDPETQVLLPLLATDLVDVVQACLRGRLADLDVRWHEGAAATVVCAAEGYPASPRKGDPITGLDAAAALHGVTVFHAGTKRGERGVVTSGGRVLAVTGRGATLREAIGRAYAGVAAIDFAGCHFRRDIGHRALAHEREG